MNGSVTVRQAEDLEGGALTYAEIKAIASGNPAVMEKVKVDTEIRKLDQLRAAHINQQHNIRWQIKSLPEQIERGQEIPRGCHGRYRHPRCPRGRGIHDEGRQPGILRQGRARGSRQRPQHRRHVMARRQDAEGARALQGLRDPEPGQRRIKDGEPDLFIRGKETYKANLNPDSPLGTIASIEPVLRSLDRSAEEEQREIERQEKALADYKAQLGRPFEHEARLKELLVEAGAA